MTQQVLNNLNNPEKIEDLKNVIDDIIAFDAIDKAKELLVELDKIFSENPDFAQADQSLFNIFSGFLISLKFVLIFELPDKEVIDLIGNHLDFIFDHPEYDLDRKIKYKISSLPSLEERDAFKEKMRQSLLNNKMPFGHNKIIVSGSEQEATVSSWLKDYHIKLGIDSVDALKMSEYIVNDPNTKNLSAEEKIKLKILFNFFEKIKVSSDKFPVFEESFVAILPNQETALVSDGKPEKISPELTRTARNLFAIKNDSESMPASGSISGNTQSPQPVPSQPPSSQLSPLKPVAPPVQTPSSDAPPIAELEEFLKNYPPESLEHKAISQEISKLKRSELKKAQKLDAKQ